MAADSEGNSGMNAYEMIVAAIEGGQLPSGSRLRELDLAQRFGISRTPIREALKRLEVQGLVEHEPHHGSIVARLDHGAITEIYTMREVLEGTAARLAAVHATQVEIDLLKDLLENDRENLHDPIALARNNRMFHTQIHHSARNRYLLAMLQNMRSSLVILAGDTLAAPNRGCDSLAEHERLVEALERRDADAAEEAGREHIRRAFRVRLGQRLLEEVERG
jgi:DNA-binding GntR family transcriptional regulator